MGARNSRAKSHLPKNISDALLIVFLVMFSSLIYAASPAEPNDHAAPPLKLRGHDAQSINPVLYYLDDPTGKLTIDEIAAGRGGAFKPLHKPNYGFGFQGVRWVRFSLDFPEGDISNEWFIEQTYLHVQNWRLFYPSENGFSEYLLSEDAKTIERPFNVHQFLFKLPIKKGFSTYYSSFEPRGHALNIDLNVMPEKRAIEVVHAKTLGLGLFFGGLAALLLYNAFLCVALRSKDYLLYIYYLSFSILSYVYLTGVAPLLVDLSTWWEQFFAACGFLAVHAMIQFGRHVLRLKSSFVLAERYLAFFAWILLAGAIASFFLPVGIHYPLLDVLILFSLPVLMVAGIRGAYQGYPPARIYALGWVLFLLALIVYVLLHLGFLPPNFLTLHAIQVASVLEAALFSFALALRFKIRSEAAVQAKNSFIAMVSHELKTPLQSIVSSLDLISSDVSISRHKKAFNRLMSAAGHLEMQVKDLTDFARLESGKLTLRNSEFDLVSLIAEVVEDYSAAAATKSLSLSYKAFADELHIFSDPLRVKQILNNLVENAIKYTNQGFVEIRLVSLLRNPSMVLIEVEDSGIGINADDINSIYDPFTQVDQGVSRKYNGIGMGLTIVRNLVLLMGGKVDLDSCVGKGTTFQVAIPYKPASAEAGSLEQSEPPCQGTRLLLVDDNEEVRLVLGEILHSLNYQVDCAASGRAALSMAAKTRYSAVLLDINMPELDGFEVAHELREMPVHTSTPIIWISATRPELADRTKSTMFTHFIEKPIHAEDIRRLLVSIIG